MPRFDVFVRCLVDFISRLNQLAGMKKVLSVV